MNPACNPSALPSTVAFGDTTLTLINRSGVPHLTARELARALGYADERSIGRIYQRNAAEFTESMQGVVNLTTPGGQQGIRLFSPRGCHLIAMFARTPRAAEFRRWVLDVLEGMAAHPAPPPAPVFTRESISRFIREQAEFFPTEMLVEVAERVSGVLYRRSLFMTKKINGGGV